MRLSALFAAVCIAIMAGTAGALIFYYLSTSVAEALAVSLAILAALAWYHSVVSRIELRAAIDDRVAELARAGADLARQVAESNRRIEALESSVEGTVNSARAVVDPLALQISDLDTAVKQLAASVASHQAILGSTRSVDVPFAPGSPATAAVRQQTDPLPIELAQLPPQPGQGTRASNSDCDSGNELLASIHAAIESNGVDLYLQPVVTLPQRKVRYYEGLARLRTANGSVLGGADFIPQAESIGVMPKIDSLIAFRCVQVLRRLLLKNRDVGLFCNLSGATLADSTFPQLLDFMAANRAIASSLVLQVAQRTLRGMDAAQHESLDALAELGYRFSLDNVTDLRIEPRELADRGFRFIKADIHLLLHGMPFCSSPSSLSRPAGQGSAADLPDRFDSVGVDLIADQIETEADVVSVLDLRIRFGQGRLFSPPRPARAEGLQARAAEGIPHEAQHDPGPAVASS